MDIPEQSGYGMFPVRPLGASELTPHSSPAFLTNIASPHTVTPTFAKFSSYFNVYLDTLKALYWENV